MATKIITKNGSGAPSTVQVDKGELAVDLTNKQLYTNDGNAIIKLGGSGSSGEWEVNGNDIYYNDGNVGIGTSDPARTLSVKSSRNRVALFESSSTNDIADLAIANGGGGGVIGYHSGSFVVTTGGDALTGLNGSQALTIDATGNVGIGVDSPESELQVYGDINLGLSSEIGLDLIRSVAVIPPPQNHGYVATANSGAGGVNGDLLIAPRTSASASVRFITGTSPTERMRISGTGDATFYGNVGIGIAPVTFDLSAKEQLAEWKTKAKKASWPIVTDGAFEQEPTEELVAEWIETRAAGDKLQVAGNISATGSVTAETFDGIAVYRAGQCGFQFASGQAIVPTGGSINALGDTVDLGSPTFKFKDAHFSGTVSCNAHLIPNGSAGAFGVLGSSRIEVFDLADQKQLAFYAGTALVSSFYNNGNATFQGTVKAPTFDGTVVRSSHIIQDGAPVVDSLQIIRAFMKLRDAVDDPDSTVEELRDKLKVAVVDIIDQFQDQIDTMPDLETPVVMPSPEEPVVMPSPTDLPE